MPGLQGGHLSHLLVVVVAEIQLVGGGRLAVVGMDIVRVCGSREGTTGDTVRNLSPGDDASAVGAGGSGAPTGQRAAQDLCPQADGAVLEPALGVDAQVTGHHRHWQQVQHRRLGVLVPREDLGGTWMQPMRVPMLGRTRPGGCRDGGLQQSCLPGSKALWALQPRLVPDPALDPSSLS